MDQFKIVELWENGGLLVTLSILFFGVLIVYSLLKFFSVFFDFIQAKGCLTIGLIALVGLPGIIGLSIVSGHTHASLVLIIVAILGFFIGFILRDSEGNVGKFGMFIMIISIITLLIVLITSKYVGFA